MKFVLQVFYEFSSQPVSSFTCVRLWNPDKPINELWISLDNSIVTIALPLWNCVDNLKYQTWIPEHGGANFRIPVELAYFEDSVLRVFDGAKLLKKIKMKDLRISDAGHV